MSLRHRLNLMLVVTVLIMLVAGSLLVGFNARRSVATEIESSILLAGSLIESGMALEDASEDSFLRWLDKFLAVSESRHLKVTVASLSPINEAGSGEALSLSVPDVPDWFIESVRPEYSRKAEETTRC
jgi:two-component system sensor histidine kinase UhpB